MKYLHLIWAALFRRKTRTILTLVSIITAFLLFGMLDAVRAAFDSGGNSLAGVDRLITSSKYSIIQSLPQALQSTIFPQKNGDKTWAFDIVGIYTVGKDAANGLDQQFLLHWKYFDEASLYTRHEMGW